MPDLDFLSRLGSEGRFPNNMYQDVMRRLNATPGLPPCTQCEIPSLTGATTASLCLPHETFAHLYHQRPKQFFKQFLPHGHESMISFWGSCRGGASLKDEQVLSLTARSQLQLMATKYQSLDETNVGVSRLWYFHGFPC